MRHKTLVLHGPDCREQKKDNSNERNVPYERAEQGNAPGVEDEVNKPGRKIETSAPFAEGALTIEHVNKKNRSHKNRERLKEVLKCSFQASCYARERRDFGLTRAGYPT